MVILGYALYGAMEAGPHGAMNGVGLAFFLELIH